MVFNHYLKQILRYYKNSIWVTLYFMVFSFGDTKFSALQNYALVFFFVSVQSLRTPYSHICLQLSGFFHNCETTSYGCLGQTTENSTNSR